MLPVPARGARTRKARPAILRSAIIFRGLLIASACAGTLSLTACRHTAGGNEAGLFVHQEISPEPVHVGPETVNIRLQDASAQPIAGAKIMVEADMAHPGMSPVFAEAKQEEPGVYLATLNLNMGGDWVVLTHITLPDGKKAERQMDVRGVRSN